jgi:hypothetical protein
MEKTARWALGLVALAVLSTACPAATVPSGITGIAFVNSSVTAMGSKAVLPQGGRIYPLGSKITGAATCPTNRYHTDGEIVAVLDYGGPPTAGSLQVTRHPARGGTFQDAPYYIDLNPGRTLQFIGPIFEDGTYDLVFSWGFAGAHQSQSRGSFTLARGCKV